jgi:glutaredoxin-like protein
MTQLLDENIQQQVRNALAQMKEPVHVLFFGSKQNCEYCNDTHQLIEEVTALSDKLSLSVYDIDSDAAIAAQYHVDKTPGLVIAAKDGKTFAGIPAGHEFVSLIQDIIFVSSRDSGLSAATREQLKSLQKPVLLQVFATPT